MRTVTVTFSQSIASYCEPVPVMPSTAVVDTVRTSRPTPWAPSGLLSGTHAPVLVLALAGLLLGIRRAEAPYADTDILWGARSGLDILSGSGLPNADGYSWTAHGAAWIPNSWGWNVLLGIAYRAGGYAGIALLGIVALAGTGALLGVAVRRAGGTTAWGSLIAQITLGFFALFLYPRAQLADYAAVVALPLLLRTIIEASRSAVALRAGAALVAVQVVWVNLHTAAVLGPVILLVAGGARLLKAPSVRTARRLVLLLVGSAAACLATPYGTAPLTHLQQVRDASVGLISEWRPAGIASPEQLLALAAIVLGLIAAILAWRRHAVETVALLLLFAVMSAAALRFAPLLVITAVPPLAAAAQRIPARPKFVNRICAAALAVLAVFCVEGAPRFADPGLVNTSPSLVAALPARCRLVNDMALGGAVILNRPDVLVSIDSRNDMYGRQRELTALRVLGDPTFGERYVESNGVSCVLAPTGAPLVTALRHSTQWRVVAHDPIRTLLVPAAAG